MAFSAGRGSGVSLSVVAAPKRAERAAPRPTGVAMQVTGSGPTAGPEGAARHGGGPPKGEGWSGTNTVFFFPAAPTDRCQMSNKKLMRQQLFFALGKGHCFSFVSCPNTGLGLLSDQKKSAQCRHGAAAQRDRDLGGFGWIWVDLGGFGVDLGGFGVL